MSEAIRVPLARSREGRFSQYPAGFGWARADSNAALDTGCRSLFVLNRIRVRVDFLDVGNRIRGLRYNHQNVGT